MSNGDCSAPDPPLRVGYVLKMFPRLSETFILNELLALEAAGIDASVFSLMYPDDGRFHGRLATLRLTAIYVPQDKPELHWQALQELPAGVSSPFARWEEAAAFLRRHRIPRDLELLLRAARVAAEVRTRGIAHVHAHFATVATHVAALVNILTGVPFSFTSHAKDIFRSTVNRELYAELAARAAFNITVTDFNRKYILEHTPGIDPAKVVRLYNGIDLDFFALPSGRTKSATPHVVSIGRLVPKKGFDVLLRALRIWKDEGGSFRATIIGDGEESARLTALRDSLGLARDVEFAGALPQEEVRRVYGQATIAALACVADELGNQDALPTTLLEALALGVPIVATKLSGIPEIVSEECGLLAPPGDAAAFAAQLRAMEERISAGKYRPELARRRAEQLFDLHANVAVLAARFRASAARAQEIARERGPRP